MKSEKLRRFREIGSECGACRRQHTDASVTRRGSARLRAESSQTRNSPLVLLQMHPADSIARGAHEASEQWRRCRHPAIEMPPPTAAVVPVLGACRAFVPERHLPVLSESSDAAEMRRNSNAAETLGQVPTVIAVVHGLSTWLASRERRSQGGTPPKLSCPCWPQCAPARER